MGLLKLANVAITSKRLYPNLDKFSDISSSCPFIARSVHVSSSKALLLIHSPIDDLHCSECRSRSKNLNPPCGRKQREAKNAKQIVQLLDKISLNTDLIENRVVNPMIIPNRVFTSDTKHSTNIGIVVSNGAKRVHRTSAASDIFPSLYSLSPNSSSLMEVFFAVTTINIPLRNYIVYDLL